MVERNGFVDIAAYNRAREQEWRSVRNQIIERARELTGKVRATEEVCSCGNHYALGVYDEEGNLKMTVCPREYYVAKYLYYSLDPNNDPQEFVKQHDMAEFLRKFRIDSSNVQGEGR